MKLLEEGAQTLLLRFFGFGDKQLKLIPNDCADSGVLLGRFDAGSMVELIIHSNCDVLHSFSVHDLPY